MAEFVVYIAKLMPAPVKTRLARRLMWPNPVKMLQSPSTSSIPTPRDQEAPLASTTSPPSVPLGAEDTPIVTDVHVFSSSASLRNEYALVVPINTTIPDEEALLPLLALAPPLRLPRR
ncbi:hypothetical protein B0H19DRAFT_1248208 [Mycena capillaripes]|nr:hypothetical protein B0H19DRAFT_1248208 [Mycena capillaripes]